MHQMDVSIPYRQIYNPQIPQVKIMKPKLKTASIWKCLLLITYKTSTAKQVLGNCERMVLANFIGNRLSTFIL